MPYLAYRYKNMRSSLYMVAQALTTASALLLWLVPLSAKGALLFAVIILPSTGGGYAVLMGHILANTAGYTKRTLSSSGLYIGYCLGKRPTSDRSEAKTNLGNQETSSDRLPFTQTMRHVIRQASLLSLSPLSLRDCSTSSIDFFAFGIIGSETAAALRKDSSTLLRMI